MPPPNTIDARLSVPASLLVRENISVLMMFAFSRAPLLELNQSWLGEWKMLRQTIFEIAQRRAERAILELAIFVRYLDDEEGISQYVSANANFDFGQLHLPDGSEQPLRLRDVANKIIHSKGFEWDISTPIRPKLICFPREEEKWSRAAVDIVNLATICGNLM